MTYRPGTILFRKYHAGSYAVLTILENDRMEVNHGGKVFGPTCYTQAITSVADLGDDGNAVVTMVYEPPLEYPAGTILYNEGLEVTYVKDANGVWHYVALNPPNRLTPTALSDANFQIKEWTVQSSTETKEF